MEESRPENAKDVWFLDAILINLDLSTIARTKMYDSGHQETRSKLRSENAIPAVIHTEKGLIPNIPKVDLGLTFEGH